MSVKRLLRHTCAIDRNDEDDVNALAEDGDNFGVNVANGVKCLYLDEIGIFDPDMRYSAGTELDAPVIFFLPDQDVKSGDRISAIKSSRGEELEPEYAYVSNVARYAGPRDRGVRLIMCKLEKRS